MDYIVLDLEWNQGTVRDTNEEIPFEIIEIGAVKVNENYDIVSRFNRLINPVIYPEIYGKISDVIPIEQEELEKYGETFPQVINDFLDWCGGKYMFCTWGPMDLSELQRNMDYYKITNPFKCPLLFYDIQKLFSLTYEDGKIRRSLEYAVEALGFFEDRPFHRAAEDAYYTALVMKTLDMQKFEKYLSVDYHRVPRNRSEEIYMVFDNYSKFVSREFTSKEDALVDKGVHATVCYLCGKSVKKKVRWFSCNSKSYLCLSYCPVHGWLKGKIRMKKPDNSSGVFVVKTLKLVDEEQARMVMKKKDELRLKRRAKRQQDGEKNPPR